MALGEDVQVEKDVFGGILRGLAAIDGVLAALDGARAVFVAAKSVGNAEVGLLDAAEHLLVELFLKGFCGFEIGVGVRVFGFEVGEHAGVLFVAEPGIVVDAAIVVDDVLDGFAKGEGWLKSGGPGSGGRGRFGCPVVGGKRSGGRIEIGGHFGV